MKIRVPTIRNKLRQILGRYDLDPDERAVLALLWASVEDTVLRLESQRIIRDEVETKK